MKNNYNEKNIVESIQAMMVGLVSQNYYLTRECSGVDVGSGLHISVKVRGASGGNCWGDYAQNYSVDDNEIKEDFLNHLKYNFDCLEQNELSILMGKFESSFDVYSNVNQYSDHSDYYGNYSDYNVYAVSNEKIFEVLKEMEIINDNDEKNIKELIENNVTEYREKIKFENNAKRLIQINNQIKNFDTNKKNEKNSLERRIKSTKVELENLEKKLKKYELDKENELKEFKKELVKIEKEQEEFNLKNENKLKVNKLHKK